MSLLFPFLRLARWGLVLSFLALPVFNSGWAQESGAPAASAKSPTAQATPPVEVSAPGGVYSALPPREWLIDPDHLNSLFFSTWTRTLIDEARRGLKARAPTAAELAAGLSSGLEEEKKIDPGLREISLSGIVFADSKDWTVWLNGQRVRQDAMPAEILDLKVSRTYVDLKWFDAYTNQVFPIRLRPHQRFNLDSRIFLPG